MDRALRGTKLVKDSTLQQAFTSGASVDEDTGYGFGWFIEKRRGQRTVWHSGNTIGCTQFIRRYLDRKFTIIVQANRSNAPLAELADKIEEVYLDGKSKQSASPDLKRPAYLIFMSRSVPPCI